MYKEPGKKGNKDKDNFHILEENWSSFVSYQSFFTILAVSWSFTYSVWPSLFTSEFYFLLMVFQNLFPNNTFWNCVATFKAIFSKIAKEREVWILFCCCCSSRLSLVRWFSIGMLVWTLIDWHPPQQIIQNIFFKRKFFNVSTFHI